MKTLKTCPFVGCGGAARPAGAMAWDENGYTMDDEFEETVQEEVDRKRIAYHEIQANTD